MTRKNRYTVPKKEKYDGLTSDIAFVIKQTNKPDSKFTKRWDKTKESLYAKRLGQNGNDEYVA